MASFCNLKVGNTYMIHPPTPNTNPMLSFSLPSVGMGTGIHHRDYPHCSSLQKFSERLPVSYKGWTKDFLQDRGARSHQYQVDEKASFTTPQSLIISTNIAIQTHSNINRLDAQTRSVPIHCHSQEVGKSHYKNFSPPV